VADRVDRQRLFGCLLRLLDDLGWRVTGLCHLRASDLDFTPGFGRPYGVVRKSPLVDKEQADVWVPLSRHARATIGRLLRRGRLSAGDHAFLFPAPRGAGNPWSRYHVRDLLERAEVIAGIAPVGGVHAWRRKWATERKGHPEVDVMRAGAWRDSRSLKEAYTRPDAQSTYAVVSRRTGVVRRAT
jgi:site-specific recombinase XerD